MTDVHIKLGDGIREVSVDITGGDDEPLTRAEATALRLYAATHGGSPSDRRTGFGGWALASDTERSPEE